MANVNGQQVLIRPVGNNQAQIVAQWAPGSVVTTTQVQQPVLQTSTIPATVTTTVPSTTPAKAIQQMTTAVVTKPVQEDGSQQVDHEQLLVGQPPGTIIKSVTAQVMQTQQGPRIYLQGLQGTNFSPQQLHLLQQQVKQQLLKGKNHNI